MTRTISFKLNGEPVAAEIKPHHNLVEVLQREFNLLGARESCGQGMCGCCTVLVDGTAVSGCLYLAAFADGADVKTVESLADGDTLSPVQEAFIEAGAFQCGFCTPGFVLMTEQLLMENPDPDEEAIRHYLSGNLCRCAAYPEIIKAVRAAAESIAGLRNMKKGRINGYVTSIEQAIIAVHDAENEADEIYHRYLGELFESGLGPFDVIKWKEIYEIVEGAIDCCEDVANSVHGIVLKNA